MFFAEPELLDRLFLFIQGQGLNSTLAGYFGKLVLSLLNRNSARLLEYLTTNSLTHHLAEKIYSRSISEIVTKILTLEVAGSDQSVFLDTRRVLLLQVLEQLSSCSEISYYFVGQILTEFIAKCPEVNSWKELFGTLMGPDCIKVLVEAACSSCPSSICAGLGFFKAVLGSNSRNELIRPSRPAQSEEDSTIIEDEETCEFIKIVIQLIPRLRHALKRPTELIEGTNRVQVRVFGEDRLKIVDFLLVCVKTDSKEIAQELIRSGILVDIIDLFFEFNMNSMLHCLVEQILSTAIGFSSSETEYTREILVAGQLVEKLSANYDMSQGYSGHATKLGADLIKAYDRNDTAREILSESSVWKSHYSERLLKRIEVEKKALGEMNAYRYEDNFSEKKAPVDDSSTYPASNLTSYPNFSATLENSHEIPEETEEKKDEPMNLDELKPIHQDPSPEDNSPNKVLPETEWNNSSPHEIDMFDREELAVSQDNEKPAHEPQPDEEPNARVLVPEINAPSSDRVEDMIIDGAIPMDITSDQNEKKEEEEEKGNHEEKLPEDVEMLTGDEVATDLGDSITCKAEGIISPFEDSRISDRDYWEFGGVKN